MYDIYAECGNCQHYFAYTHSGALRRCSESEPDRTQSNGVNGKVKNIRVHLVLAATNSRLRYGSIVPASSEGQSQKSTAAIGALYFFAHHSWNSMLSRRRCGRMLRWFLQHHRFQLAVVEEHQ